MRLEFNIVVIDDDLEDADEKEAVEALIDFVEGHVKGKGFKAIIHSFPTVEKYQDEMTESTKNRIDLFLSDNNLGAGLKGIAFYIGLSTTGIHDFILYTRDSHSSIVNELVKKLQESEDPNLFTSFTFVHRGADDSWWESIEDVLDHVLSKREEINNLRGLYAQEMSKVENHLRKKLQASSGANLETLINNAETKKLIDLELKQKLHSQRHRRNGIIHNDEQFCKVKKKWYVIYEENGNREKRIHENEFSTIRNHLAEVVKKTMQI